MIDVDERLGVTSWIESINHHSDGEYGYTRAR